MAKLEHDNCSVLLFPHKYYNYNENLQIKLFYFVNFPKLGNAPYITHSSKPIITYDKKWYKRLFKVKFKMLVQTWPKVIAKSKKDTITSG